VEIRISSLLVLNSNWFEFTGAKCEYDIYGLLDAWDDRVWAAQEDQGSNFCQN
jgi:hypothetical protein